MPVIAAAAADQQRIADSGRAELFDRTHIFEFMPGVRPVILPLDDGVAVPEKNFFDFEHVKNLPEMKNV